MSVQKLDGIFDSHNVVVLSFIDQINNRSQRRALATAGRSSHQHDPVLNIDDLFKLFRKIKVTELWRMHGDHAHHDGVGAPLLKDVHSKARFARSTEGEISGTSLFQT